MKEPTEEDDKEFMNKLLHGEYTTFTIMQEVLAGIMALSTHDEYIDSLVAKLEACNFAKLKKYYSALAMIVHQLGPQMKTDPQIKEIQEQAEKARFMSGLGMPQ